ncbi:hypothetical protein [Lysobacter arvi]|uniref:Uncharacterized protein n=1 Tax=Lysobacter arvi TaxID=3038776 RepID=A0ABU1CFF8_9GAMM|nr:hypothetical protein [Lysobacter arvi]MDR0183687.1 hypothetical protein [Lysobacter arvi]
MRMAVAVHSQTRDPANADNDAAARVSVVTAADLSVHIEGGVLPPSPHRLAGRAHAP